MHLPMIVQDLAVILIVAGFMTLLFRAIGQPVVLGYLIAGFLVGPHFKWVPNVLDHENVKVWAEIGVIFLLFALGLEFSFKKLARVGLPASVITFVEVAGMVAIGFLLGRAFGWKTFDSLFLGGILAISSTTIIIRAVDELGLKTRGFVQLVLGVLIVEDLVAILLLVILSTIAVSRNISGLDLGVSVLKLGFFLTLWFVLGIFLLPTFFKRVRNHLPEETLLVVSLGLCFLMVVLATKAGFSPALGAFIMGSLLAETLEAERIEHLIRPVKDLFGAVFFVSVGMMIDPQVVGRHALPILIITLITVLGKFLTTLIGALTAGQSLRRSVQTGMSLAQIGEFSFIIAGLGLDLKVTSDFLYPIAISVSTVTTFTTPYLIRSSDPFVRWLERRLSPETIRALERFRADSGTESASSAFRTYAKRTLLKAFMNGVVVAAIFLTTSEFLKPWLLTQIEDANAARLSALIAAFLCSTPFLWAILRSGRGERPAGPWLAVEICRWTLAVTLCAVLASRIVPPGLVILGVSTAALAGVYIFSRSFERLYRPIENRFILNLNEKDLAARPGEMPALAPWDSHLAEVTVSPESPMAGRKLLDLALREKFGVMIVLIMRGRLSLPAPSRSERLFPGDVLKVLGTDEEIKRFAAECESPGSEGDEPPAIDYVLRPIRVQASAPFANKTVLECGIRERARGLVVGIEKKGKRTVNPDAATVIAPGDTIWVVGDRDRVEKL